MKKILLILTVLFLWAGCSWGAITVTIGTGTSITSGTTSDVTPYKTYWMDGQDQILFTAAELTAAGLGAGNIEKLAFNVGSAQTYTLSSFTISMQQIPATTLTGFLTTGWTQCFTGNVVAVLGWNTYTFTTPFAWDGTSSVVFKVCFNNAGYTNNSHVYYTTTPTGVHAYWYNDLATSSGCDVTTSSGLVARPNVQITGQPGALPILSAIPASLSFGYTTVGTPVPANPGLSYVLSGTNLSAGPIVVTPPAGFEVSSDGSTWVGTLNVTYTPPTLANTTIYVRFNPLAANTDYTGNVTNVGGGTSANVAVTGTTWEYKKWCPSAATTNADEEIFNVTLGTINSTSDCSTLAPGAGSVQNMYSNYYYDVPATDLSRGSNNAFSVQIGTCGGNYGNSVAIYIDFDQNGVFDLPGDRVYLSAATTTGPHTETGSIMIPLGAALGNTMMRVVNNETAPANITPCGTYSWGETEDYKVNITPVQAGTLQGYVFDMEGGCTTPLSGASVSNGIFTALTNASGFYQFTDLPIGTYSFTASLTGYVNSTITGITVTLGGTTNQDFCLTPNLLPPVGLAATVAGNNAHVSWMAPGSLPAEQWIMWDDGTNTGNAIGATSGGTFSVASKWVIADIAPYTGMHLKKIRIFANDAAATYKLQIWTGSSVTPVYEQPVTPVLGWNEFLLTSSFLITGTEDVTFGYEVTHAAGTFPAGCDNGPSYPLLDGKGNVMLWNGTWTTLYTLAATLNYNWNIHGWLAQTSKGTQQLIPLVQNPQPSPVENLGTVAANNSQSNQLQTTSNNLPGGFAPVDEVAVMTSPMSPQAPLTTFTGYNLYKNTVKIQDNIPALFYDDLGLLPGGYDYEVSAQYTYGESVKVGPVHVDIYSCFAPTNVQVPAATTTMTSAQVSWTPSLISLNPEWVYEYGPAGFAHGAGIGGIQYIDSPFLPLNTLTAGTEYDFYVATYCAAGDTSLWVKKTFRTHYFECPTGATAELEACGSTSNDGCNMTVPAFEPLACGETKCGTGWFNGSNRDTDWYEFTLGNTTTVTWSGKAEFSYVLGFVASPCPATAFIASAVGAAGTTVTVTTTLAPGTYYAFAASDFAEIVKCDSLQLYFATLTCNADIIPPVITNVVSTPASCTAIAHTVTADITDDISVGAVNIVWTLNGVAQPNIPMTLGVAPSYSGVIPAQGSGVVAFHIAASDNATPVNTATTPVTTYQDAYLAALNFSAGTDQIKPLGSTANLNATYVQNASCLRITEFTLYSTGTGATSPYPAFMTAGTYDDLVEITNTGTAATDLAGIHLKCEGLRATDYTFPSAIVPPGGVVIVAFGTAANDIPNLYFSTGQSYDSWSSGTSNGIWLTTSSGTIIDAVSTNSWVFSVASGVTASDWSGAGVSSPGGYAGAGLHGADANSSTNWVYSGTTAQNIGTLNTGVPLTCSVSAYTVTWSGGNLPAPVVANPIVTPAFAAPGTYTFTATLSDGTCTVSDDVNVDVPVPVAPVADFTVNNTAQTTGGVFSTALFTDLSTNLPDSWLWTITGPGVANFVNSTTPASQNPQVQFMAPGLYTVELTASNSAGSDAETKVDYISVTVVYCASSATTIYDEEIFSVTVNGATNAYNCTTVAPGPGSVLNMYSNFTTLGSLTSIQQTATINFSVLEDECDGSPYYYNGCAIWIDYNQDGDYTDADEQVYVDAVTASSPRTIAGSFVVPATAALGVTHMRVIVAEGAAGVGLTPCMSYGYGETEDYLITIDAAPLTKTLTVTAFLEGLYNGTGLNQALDEFGPHFGPGIADQVYLELHNDVAYSVIEYPVVPTLVDISTSGVITVNDIPSSLSGSYYITIKHRNSIETTSGAPVSFAGGTVNYDFTTAAAQAYGSNLLGVGGAFVIYGGDVNQDGYVDTGDMNPVENASTAFTSGYVPEDANGDGFVDTSDMNIVENNSTAFVGIILP